jgi:hypothetical protein
MAAAITVSQSGLTPNTVTVTDISTSLSGTITQRRIFVSDANSTYLTGDGTVDWTLWPLANAFIDLAILTESIGALIKVQFLNVSDVVVTEYENTYPLSRFDKNFFYYLLQLQGLTPGIYQDSNYSGNLALYWSNIIGGDNAITYGNDLAAAQSCYNRATEMRTQEAKYF